MAWTDVKKAKIYQVYAFELEAPAVNKFLLVGLQVLTAMTMKITIFWDVSCLAYTSNLKVETVFLFETSVEFYRSIRPYVPEDGAFKVTTYCKRNNRLSGKVRNFTKSGQIWFYLRNRKPEIHNSGQVQYRCIQGPLSEDINKHLSEGCPRIYSWMPA
jgi:hypothetical protein